MRKIKPRPCGCKCGLEFIPKNSLHVAATPECAIRIAKAKAERRHKEAEKVARKAVKERKEALKTRSDYIKECQKAFNAFIRARDRGKPCICCGKPWREGGAGGAFDCGHYRSVGSAPHLRFVETNAHGQDKQCNRWGSGRAVDYRIGLIARIGLEAVEALEADQTDRKYTIDELKVMIADYRRRTRELLRNT